MSTTTRKYRYLGGTLLFVLGIVLVSLPRSVQHANFIQQPKPTTAPPEKHCGAEVCPNQVLVKFTECPSFKDIRTFSGKFADLLSQFSKDELQKQIKDSAFEVKQVGSGCLFQVSSPFLTVRDLMQLVTQFQTMGNVRLKQQLSSFGLDDVRIQYVEPNFKIYFYSPNEEDSTATLPNHGDSTARLPNDDYFVRGQLWGLLNQTNPSFDIDVVRAWRYTTGSEQIVVGTMDTGITYLHEDLKDNVWCARRAFTVHIAGEKITCPKGSHGYNALGRTEREKCDPTDFSGHGTIVAGIIGARGNNTIGVVGVNWKVALMGLRIGDATGTCTSNAINAIDFALQVKKEFPETADLRVLNNSWGFLLEAGCEEPKSLREKMAAAGLKDIVVVCSAGENDGNDNDANHHFPSGFDLPNLLSVTAFDQAGDLTTVQGQQVNHGLKTVHLGAPGDVIFSTAAPPRTYYHGSQTSVAAPFVSGAAALLLSSPRCANLHAPDIKRLILHGAIPTPSLAKTVTGGRLSVYRSLLLCP